MSKRVDSNKLICIHYGGPVKSHEKDSCYEWVVRTTETRKKINRETEFVTDALNITYLILLALVSGTGTLAALGIILNIL